MRTGHGKVDSGWKWHLETETGATFVVEEPTGSGSAQNRWHCWKLNLGGLQFPVPGDRCPIRVRRCSVSFADELIHWRIAYSILAPLQLIRDDAVNLGADARNPIPNRQTNISVNSLIDDGNDILLWFAISFRLELRDYSTF